MRKRWDEPIAVCECICHLCIGFGGRIALDDPLGELMACSKCAKLHKPYPPSNPNAIPHDRRRWPYNYLPPQPFNPDETEDGC